MVSGSSKVETVQHSPHPYASSYVASPDYDYTEYKSDRSSNSKQSSVHSSGFGDQTGAGGYGSDHKDECCPLVVCPLTLLALLGLLAGGTGFLANLINKKLGGGRKKKRSTPSVEWIGYLLLQGKDVNSCTFAERRRNLCNYCSCNLQQPRYVMAIDGGKVATVFCRDRCCN
jgi:hypothetical protein